VYSECGNLQNFLTFTVIFDGRFVLIDARCLG